MHQFLNTAEVPLVSEENKSIKQQVNRCEGAVSMFPWCGQHFPQMSMLVPGVTCGTVMEPLRGGVWVELIGSLEAYSLEMRC